MRDGTLGYVSLPAIDAIERYELSNHKSSALLFHPRAAIHFHPRGAIHVLALDSDRVIAGAILIVD
jgi:hypothetical protein